MADEHELTPEQVKSRAKVLCAMDLIMHHLNDEEDCEGWLMNGVPDGGPLLDLDDEQMRYYGSFVDDFEDCVRLFASIVRRVCFKVKYEKGGFC